MNPRWVLGLCLALLLGGAHAQAYPTKPVRFVVPASPGGASDLIARMIAPALAETLGQPFIVENRVTSGGIVGTQQVAESPGDGYTLLVTFDTFAINPYVFKNLKWDPVRDFAPVMQICRYPQVLLVHPGLGVRSLSEFVALAKQKGASLNYGTAGPASSSRLAYELFKDVAGIETVPVHYKGAGPAIQDLLSGQVQAMLVQGGGSILQHVKTGKLIALAISSLERSKFYPELPLIADTYPGFETESWVAMFAPAATPKPVIDSLHGALVKHLSEPATKEKFEAQGCDLVVGTPEALAARVRSDQAKWSKIVREKNISVE
ncbi:MAG TPA: tripartite tricarboxylate transporter substrate binding protein [Burkholderiales bacterium]|nr:tripartite tricarboxylate transporter substrate binding protein [Burkholderiales bacterium]